MVVAITVTYNDAHFLTKCVDALKRQTAPVDKIVVVDNNNVIEAIQNNLEYIQQQTLIKQLKISDKEEKMQFSFNEKLDDCEIKILFSVI